MKQVFGFFVAILAVLVTVGCGGSPASPTAGAPSAALAVSTPATAASAGPVTTTWNCFAGSRAGIFSPSGCASALVIGAESLHKLAGTPSTPTGLQFTVAGSTVTLTWSYTSGQNPNASSYVVEAGSAAGLSDLASFDTGNGATSLTVTAVPSGTYYVRVRARALDRTLGAGSNEIILAVGDGPSACTSAPGVPTGLSGATNGSTVNLAWSSPSGGCAATSYVLEAGSAAGSSTLASFNTGSTATQYTANGVAAGTYYVRVRAANASSTSAASNEVTLVVGGAQPLDVTGQWIGLVANGDGLTVNGEKWDWRLDLIQTGSAVTGTLTQTDVIPCRDAPNCRISTAPLTGTVASATFSFVISPGRKPITGTATFSAMRMTGTVGGADGSGPVALNRQ